jgi:hypothetical protein
MDIGMHPTPRPQRKRPSMHKLAVMLAATIVLAACSSSQAPQQPAASSSASAPASPLTDAAEVRSLVERFGKRMQKISTLAPADAVRQEFPKVYAGLLSPELFDAWRAHPDQVVGREGSSPWPQQIEIDDIECAGGDTCHVEGRVDYITSNEVTRGGVFMRRPITLDVANTKLGWRITAVQLSPARD